VGKEIITQLSGRIWGQGVPDGGEFNTAGDGSSYEEMTAQVQKKIKKKQEPSIRVVGT